MIRNDEKENNGRNYGSHIKDKYIMSSSKTYEFKGGRKMWTKSGTLFSDVLIL